MRQAFENLEIGPDKAVAAEAATGSRLKAADALIGLAVRPCIYAESNITQMQATSPIRRCGFA